MRFFSHSRWRFVIYIIKMCTSERENVVFICYLAKIICDDNGDDGRRWRRWLCVYVSTVWIYCVFRAPSRMVLCLHTEQHSRRASVYVLVAAAAAAGEARCNVIALICRSIYTEELARAFCRALVRSFALPQHKMRTKILLILDPRDSDRFCVCGHVFRVYVCDGIFSCACEWIVRHGTWSGLPNGIHPLKPK